MATETRDVVNTENEAVKAAHSEEIRQFERLPVAQKKDRKRPARKKTKCQTVACYCFQMNCLLQQSGGTCPSCRNVDAVGQSNIEVDINGQRVCTCEICRCDCCIHFPRNQRYEVALACASENEMAKEMVNVDEPSNTVSLLGNVIVSGVQNGVALAQQQRPQGTPAEIEQDACAFALQGLLGGTQFRSAKAVKDLQGAMGSVPASVGGKDIGTLRREKREMRSGAELIAQQNERFVRNKLAKSQIAGPSSSSFKTPSNSTWATPIIISDGDGKAHLPTPINLQSSGKYTSSAAGRRSRIRRSSLELKYDKSSSEDQKASAAKLISITKTHHSPSRESRVTEFIEDSIALGLDTGDAKEMMIAELGNEI